MVWGFSKHPAIVRHIWFLQNDIGRVVIVIVIVEGRVVRNILTCVSFSFFVTKETVSSNERHFNLFELQAILHQMSKILLECAEK